MAIASTTVWRVRTDGNDINGAGFDSGISGAGTDYTQQAAAQLSLADIACSANTTVTSTTGGFTAAMVGNAIRITGGGATSGYYFLTAYTSTNSVTVDRSPGTVSGGTGNLGGAARTIDRVVSNDNSAGDKCVSGNYIYVMGGGTASDYTYAGILHGVPGVQSQRVRIWGEPSSPRPTIVGSGTDLWLYGASYTHMKFLSIKCGASAFGRMIEISDNCTLEDVIINTNNIDCDAVRVTSQSNDVVNCDISAGTTTPTAYLTRYGISISGGVHNLIYGNSIHHNSGTGIISNGYTNDFIGSNFIFKNKGDGLYLEGMGNGGISILNNTIDANEGNGVSVGSTLCLSHMHCFNNVITNHTGSGKYGFVVLTGTLAENNSELRFIGYNDYYGNTTAVSGVSTIASDMAVDPQYVDAANADYTPGNSSLKMGFLTSHPGSASVNCPWIGAVAPEPAAGGGGPFVFAG